MNTPQHTLIIESPVGRFMLTAEGASLLSITPTTVGAEHRLDKDIPEILQQAQIEIQEYFDHQRDTFTLALQPRGTPFQQRVWQVCSTVPYGEVISYKELAIRVAQSQKYARAVANALHCNPIPLIIPCHRVVGSDGSLTGFAWGIRVKQALLQLENPDLLRPQQEILK